MEAATPLHPPHPRVRVLGDRVAVDGLLVDDDTVVRLAREREEAGEDTGKLVTDAIEIGARVLDREQAGANAEWVKGEMEKAARELGDGFAERAGKLSEGLEERLAVVFDPEQGALAKELERRFADGSSEAVQHRVKETVAEVMTRAHRELVEQFSSADGKNPLADFKAATQAELRRANESQVKTLETMTTKLTALEVELTKLRAEREKLEEVAAVEDKSTAKGRPYEEAVYDAIDLVAQGQGDLCEPVGDFAGPTGKKGDVVVDIEGCTGPPRGRIVFEAKNSPLTKPRAFAELDDARAQRDADFAVLVVPREELVPAKTLPLREMHGDKMVVTFDPEDGSTLALQLAYSLARARVLMSRNDAEGLDAAALDDTVERAIAELGHVRKVKLSLTGATKNIDEARSLVGALEQGVRDQLDRIRELLAPVVAGDDPEES